MNWMLLFAGIPFGVACGYLGKRLVSRVKPKSATVEGLLLGTPLAIFCLCVIVVDILCAKALSTSNLDWRVIDE